MWADFVTPPSFPRCLPQVAHGELSEGRTLQTLLTANYPLEFGAVYRVQDRGGAPVSEAGIEGVRPGHRFVGVLQKETAGETNTALALANVSDEATTAAVTFFLAPSTTMPV